jgi:S1-C subfamily serine protease
LRPNDVILQVQGKDVETVRQFNRALRDRDLSAGVRLTVKSGETRHFVVLKTE